MASSCVFPFGSQYLRGMTPARVDWASDMAAMSAAEEAGKPYQIILMDHMMPGMSGYSVCRRLRDDGLLCETPVLMVTALSMLDDQLEGITCGADGFMVKPVSRFELMTRVWDLL